jgi:ribosome biogenesis GTPase A
MDERNLQIQWFPGHMTKAKRMMEEQVKLVDVVVEMVDARIPVSSTNPMLGKILQQKPRVLAFNKIDMADPRQTEAWVKNFQDRGIQVCKVNCNNGQGIKQLWSLVTAAAKPSQDKWLRKGVKNHPVRTMIAGVPNVGKSTLINKLVGQNKTIVSDRPGVTRGKQWVTVAKGLELLDTPGVLWPKFEDPQAGFCLAVTGAIKEDVFDRHTAIEILLDRLGRQYPGLVAAFYGLQAPAANVQELMEQIGKARGCIKSGALVDMNKVDQLVLRDFRTGRMGRITLDVPDK